MLLGAPYDSMSGWEYPKFLGGVCKERHSASSLLVPCMFFFYPPRRFHDPATTGLHPYCNAANVRSGCCTTVGCCDCKMPLPQPTSTAWCAKPHGTLQHWYTRLLRPSPGHGPSRGDAVGHITHLFTELEVWRPTYDIEHNWVTGDSTGALKYAT